MGVLKKTFRGKKCDYFSTIHLNMSFGVQKNCLSEYSQYMFWLRNLITHFLIVISGVYIYFVISVLAW